MKKISITSNVYQYLVLLIVFLVCCVGLTYAEGTPEREFTINITQPGQREGRLILDPHMATDTGAVHIASALFEGLLTYGPHGEEVMPGLAQTWGSNREHTVYTFTLREAYWSDGQPITAQTVKESWLRVLDPQTGSPLAWLPAGVIAGAAEYAAGSGTAEEVQLEVVDQYRLRVRLSQPVPFLERILPLPAFAVVPVHRIQEYGEEWSTIEHVACNGPFIPKWHSSGNGLYCQTNPQYWDQKGVELERLTFLFKEDPEQAYNLYRDGIIDWNTVFSPELIEKMGHRQDYQRHPYNGTCGVAFNLTDPLLNKAEVRRALAEALDREQLVAEATYSGEYPAEHLVPPMPGFVPQGGEGESAQAESQPVEQARSEAQAGSQPVEQAGEQPAEPASQSTGPEGTQSRSAALQGERISLLYYRDPVHKRVAKELRSQWQERLGVTVVLEEKPWEEYRNLLLAGKFSLAVKSWFGSYPDPSSYLLRFTSQSPLNMCGFQSARFDRLVARSYTLPFGKERRSVLEEAQQIVLNNHALIPLYYYASHNLIDREDHEGWSPNVMNIHPVKHLQK